MIVKGHNAQWYADRALL